MNTFQFHKYQGTGNDFIIIDNRARHFPDKNNVGEAEIRALIAKLCHRKFGIGADGLILIQHHPEADFEMVYYNADGSQSMCGNGSRCAVRFAKELGIIGNKTSFLAIDGTHEAYIENDLIRLKMGDVHHVKFMDQAIFIDTGSPHHMVFTKNVNTIDVYNEGRKIRYSKAYQEEGTNVNFVEVLGGNEVFVRTYERGVEGETLSCGTGVTAVALACSHKNMESPISIKTLGGDLKVSYVQAEDDTFTNIYLTGPAEKVFEGEVICKTQDIRCKT